MLCQVIILIALLLNGVQGQHTNRRVNEENATGGSLSSLPLLADASQETEQQSQEMIVEVVACD
jgi:hypothetical protein